MKSSSLDNIIYDNNTLLQQSNNTMLVTPYAKDNHHINSPTSYSSSSNDEDDFMNHNSSSRKNSNTTTAGSKRRSQVKNACVNCQKACKKCDEGRPCQRCIKLGITDTCVDSPRKERKKGFKRGPYRKKSVTTQQHIIPKRDISAATTAAPLFASTVAMKKEDNISIHAPIITSNATNWSSLASPIYNDPTTVVNYQFNGLEHYDYPPSSNSIHDNNQGLYPMTSNNHNHPINHYTTASTPISPISSNYNNNNNSFNNTSISSSYMQHSNNYDDYYHPSSSQRSNSFQYDGFYSQQNSTIASSPENNDLSMIANSSSVPNHWNNSFVDEQQLYHNTQSALLPPFVPKLGDNTMMMISPTTNINNKHYLHRHNHTMISNRSNSIDSSMYPYEQQQLDWIPLDSYYYPATTTTRYNSDYY